MYEHSDKTIIIAEAGVNHNGNIAMARQLCDVAKECGANIVKFQTFNPEKLSSKHAVMADYQKDNIGKISSQKDMLSELTLSKKEFLELADYCRRIGISFLSTPFDVDSVDFLNDVQNIWKIPSGEITDYPYLVRIAKTQKPVILSTGMSTISEIEDAVAVLKQNGTGEITILHCSTNYPALIEDINLRAMITLKEKFNCPVGYSDHTQGIEIALAAVAMGAKVIEKHFTLDRNLPGPDHKASLEPEELKELVDGIRKIEIALGSEEKIVTGSEEKNRDIVRKSIIASRKIAKGEILTEDNITTKRPGNGISPMKWNSVIGTKSIRDFDEDELIET